MRHIGPTLSSDQQSAMAAGTRHPPEGRPQARWRRALASEMIEPSVSVPMEKPQRPALAVADPEPARSRSILLAVFQGLRVRPPYQMSL